MSLLTIILGLLPGFAWLFFYLQEDPHPEPRRLIAKTFVLGAVAAVVALAAQMALNAWLGILSAGGITALTLLFLALIEELAKFWAARTSVLKSPAFNEPVDAMIYMIVAALGFATLENLGAVSGGGAEEAIIVQNAFTTSTLRFVGATLLHALASGIVGYYWALSIRGFGKKTPLIWGIALAALLHAAFNYFIIIFGSIAYSTMLLVVVGFFVLGDFEKLKRKTL